MERAPAVPHRPASRRPGAARSRAAGSRAARSRAAGRTPWPFPFAKRAALPLALVVGAGATGCRSASGPLQAMADARVSAQSAVARTCDAALSRNPDSAIGGGGRGAIASTLGAPSDTIDDPFRAVERAVNDAASANPATVPAGAPFADGFDARLAELRRDAAAARPVAAAEAGGVALAAADDRDAASADPAVTAAAASDAASDPFAVAFGDSARPDDLAAAPTGPADLFAPAAPANATADPFAAADAATADANEAQVEEVKEEVAPLANVPPGPVFDQEEIPPAREPGGADDVPAPFAANAPAEPPGGFDPFGIEGLAAAEEVEADAAPASRVEPTVEPAPAADPFGALAAPPVASVRSNGGSPPAAPVEEPVAEDPFAPGPLLTTAEGPELTFGRPPLPPKPEEEAELWALAAPEANPEPAAEPREPILSALAGPTLAAPTGETDEAVDEPREAPSLAAETPDEPTSAAAPRRSGRVAPTMPAPAASVDSTATRAGTDGERLPPMHVVGRARLSAGTPGAVELDAASMDRPAETRTASPAAPLTAGLGLGAVLLVGLSLWRRRTGLG